jgi:hypothetical protein
MAFGLAVSSGTFRLIEPVTASDTLTLVCSSLKELWITQNSSKLYPEYLEYVLGLQDDPEYQNGQARIPKYPDYRISYPEYHD